MNLAIVFGAALALILVLAVIAGRRGKRHGHLNPPRDYYDGNPMIHAGHVMGNGGGADGVGDGGTA